VVKLSHGNDRVPAGFVFGRQAGHRKSFDLDFFNRNGDFDNIALVQKFSGVKETINKENTIYGKLFNTKSVLFNLAEYPAPLGRG